MARKLVEPKIVLSEDIGPRHNWDRPITALGHMAVDFEERVNFRRLHDYRVARVRLALARSGLGALLCFDQHNLSQNYFDYGACPQGARERCEARRRESRSRHGFGDSAAC